MRLHDIFFYFVSFFLVGVFLASLKLNLAMIILIALLAACLFLIISIISVKLSPYSRIISLLSLFMIVGAFYYFLRQENQFKFTNIAFNQKIGFQGVVIDYPERGNQQKLTVALQQPYFGKILIIAKQYPSFNYGDLINFKGIIKKPESQKYADYLSKDGIFGITNYSETELIAENQASAIKSFLFKIKEGIIENFQKVLAPEKSAFLAGITLGERAEFSKELKNKMAKSGTTHLVALSGYNITIIGMAAMAFFSYFLRKKFVFWPSLLTIFAFVLMTGAEASVVRAAIMGGIVMLAKQIGRLHSMRNAIAAAAFLMVLANPKVLKFDVGFQLSFAALVGIVYFTPKIQKFFKMKEESGFLGWRENLLNTISAQLAVFPLLLAYFNNFSLISVFANVLILSAVPATMFFGFLTGAIGFVSLPFSMILGWFVNLFLSYELLIIDVFSRI